MKIVILWLLAYHLDGDPSAAAHRIHILTPRDAVMDTIEQCEPYRAKAEAALSTRPLDSILVGATVTEQRFVCDTVTAFDSSDAITPQTEERLFEKYFE